MDDAVWDHSTFSKNRNRLMQAEIAESLFQPALDRAGAEGVTSNEHFSVDGTLIEAWATLKSYRPRDYSDDPPAGGGRTRTGTFTASGARRDPCVNDGSRAHPDAQYRSGGSRIAAEARLELASRRKTRTKTDEQTTK